MNTIIDVSSQSELSFAAYANLNVGDNSDSDFISNNSNISAALAISLASRYRVIDILNDASTGAYAVVFENKITGTRTLAVRGTTLTVADIAADAYLLIGVPSNLTPQYQALESKVSQWQVAGVINSLTTLTGHSLGGYLVTALKSALPTTLGSAYTINAPGLGSVVGTATQFFQNTFGLSMLASDVYDIRGTKGLSFIGGLGQHWGSPIPVEIEAAAGAGTDNHSIGRINQPLAVLNLLAKLDPTLTLQKANELTLAASSRNEDTVEKLLHGIYSLFNPNSNQTATGNDQDLYARIGELQANPHFVALAGKVTLNANVANIATQAKARVGFEEIAALETLAPFVLKAAGADGSTALQALWGSGPWIEKYQGWQADKTALQSQGTPSSYTDSWIADRAGLLQTLLTANTKDAATNPDGYLAVQGSPSADTNLRYIDIGSGAMLQLNEVRLSPSTAPNRYVIFGDGGANTLNGSAQADHLYGGAGNDTLNGMSGNDYLEGGAGTDTYQFIGNFGHDVIIDAGGAGIIRINADVLDGGIKVTDTIWESADGQYIYVLVGADLIIGQRTSAWAATVTDTITIRNWQAGVGELGITPQTATPAAPAPQSHLTVYQDYSAATNNQGVFTNIVDGQSTTSSNSGDYNVQRTTTTGQASIVTTGTAAQFIEADSWDQQITTGVGNDLVIAGQWALPAGSHDADIVNTGEGSDMVFTGQGRDIINTGAGDDFIMSGGLASVASMQSEDLASRSPAGVARVHAHARP